jgi:hypothetical protein
MQHLHTSSQNKKIKMQLTAFTVVGKSTASRIPPVVKLQSQANFCIRTSLRLISIATKETQKSFNDKSWM